MDEGKLNSSTMHTGIAPPHGFALSIFLSKRTHSMLGFLASASAAHAPEGPPPTTATLYFWPAAVESHSERHYVRDISTGCERILLSRKYFMLTKGTGSAGGGEEDERCEHFSVEGKCSCDVIVVALCLYCILYNCN